MSLPADFDRDLWLDPLTFQGLIGTAIAMRGNVYAKLFRASDGFAKPIAELRQVPEIAHLLPPEGERDGLAH